MSDKVTAVTRVTVITEVIFLLMFESYVVNYVWNGRPYIILNQSLTKP